MPIHPRRAGVSLPLTGALLALSALFAGAAATGVTARRSAGKLQITGCDLNNTLTVRLSPSSTFDQVLTTGLTPGSIDIEVIEKGVDR